MRNPLLAPELRELLAEGRTTELAQVLEDLHPHDAASILSGLETDEIVRAISALPASAQANVFAYFPTELQEQIVLGAGRERVKELLTAMSSDDRASFLDRLDERVRESLFPLLARAAREDLIRREQYTDDQVGSLLSTEYSRLERGLTVVQAIDEVRRQAPERETIYYSYIVDQDRHLLGFVSLRDLIVARSHQKVEDIMRTDVVSVSAEADKEEAARLINEYDLIAIPVVDADRRLLGIVTYDDAADILEAEATEDLERLAGITADAADARTYMAESVLRSFRRRVPWVTILAVAYGAVAWVIGTFEQELSGQRVLIGFLPLVMAMGGNVGAQTATVVVRSLALGQVRPREFLRILWKEMRISLCLAAVLCCVVFVHVLVQGGAAEHLFRTAAAIAIALGLHVVTAATLGALIPVGLAALELDPALVANPALTTGADLSGALIYLAIVTALLPQGG